MRLTLILMARYAYGMHIELDKLNDDTRNAYEMAYAIIRRAYQITRLNEIRPEGVAMRPIPTAVNEIVTHEVNYTLESQ